MLTAYVLCYIYLFYFHFWGVVVGGGVDLYKGLQGFELGICTSRNYKIPRASERS